MARKEGELGNSEEGDIVWTEAGEAAQDQPKGLPGVIELTSGLVAARCSRCGLFWSATF